MIIYFKYNQSRKQNKVTKKRVRFAETKSDDSNDSNASTVVS